MKIITDFLKTSKVNSYSGLANEIYILLIKEYFDTSDENIIVLTNSLFEANNIYINLRNYIQNVFFFPVDEFFTRTILAASPELKLKRLETLKIIKDKSKSIIVTNLYGFLHKLPSIESSCEYIEITHEKSINRENLIQKLDTFGYARESLTTSTGEYSVRGYIIDIFPIDEEHPFRIEFFGDEIESIRMFDENTQLSLNTCKKLNIYPFTEIESKTSNNLCDYLDNPLLIEYNPQQINISYKKLVEDITRYNSENDTREFPMYHYDEIRINKKIEFNTLGKSKDIISQNIVNFNSNFDILEKFVISNIKNKKSIVLCLSMQKQIDKIKEIFPDCNLIKDIDAYEKGHINICKMKINQGFVLNDLIIIGENDIENIKYNPIKYKSNIKMGKRINSFDQIAIGDYIVHSMHGIGQYNGVVTLTKNGIKMDYIQLLYRGNDKIYIPVDKINTIFKYTVKEGSAPKLNKLSSTEWQKKKAQVRTKINDISEELIELYSERSKTETIKYKDAPEEESFALEFPYDPTPDQLKVINDIASDLRSKIPMDRLLCGDVGYGKTEVAFRAIFKAISNGQQVSYLCPTTILSKQQYESALERFKNYPVNIALVNRYRTSKEINEIINKLEEGKIDIVFGTHKLLNEKIKYKDLGLLVIDEEQRFGVIHKEKIKELKKNVNVLTLSATPIPRTLKMAMSGLRDMSIIDTPPINRYPVQTYVLPENELIIRESIYKELSRKGQIFVVYNKIKNIEFEVSKLSRLVPEARIRFAHGQMNKDTIEGIMKDFIEYEFDVLVCTTIIETGIDIINANTLIIIDADNFGLSQLYQLRGRVGRSDRIAYAYLMYNETKILTDTAMKRLKSIEEFTELGSGYKIAMRDLAIRGAGDILGSEQAGFIDSVGIELYMKMINEKVNEINGIELKEEEETVNLVNVKTHIDEAYVSDEDIIIEIHKKISEIDSFAKLNEVKTEIEDRFGNVSSDIDIYMHQRLFEYEANKLGITEINEKEGTVEVVLPEKISSTIKGDKLLLEISTIDPSITLKYQYRKIYITLYTRKFKKHFIYYLLDIINLFK